MSNTTPDDSEILPRKQSFVGCVKEGGFLALVGLVHAVQRPCIQVAYKKSLVFWAVIAGVIYVIGLSVLLPVYGVVYIVDLIFHLGLWLKLPSVLTVLLQASLAVPMFGVFFVRYVYSKPLDHIFFESLPPDLNHLLGKIPSPSISDKFKIVCRKLFRVMGIGMCLLILSLLPWFGTYIIALIQFYFTYKTLGKRLAIMVAVPSLIPGFRSSWLVAVGFGWSARAVCVELLSPLIYRIRSDKSAMKDLFSPDNQALLVSFALPWTALFMIPLLGPFTLPLFQSSVALLAERLANKPALERLAEQAQQERIKSPRGQANAPPGGPKLD